jgi:hypothetical protein
VSPLVKPLTGYNSDQTFYTKSVVTREGKALTKAAWTSFVGYIVGKRTHSDVFIGSVHLTLRRARKPDQCACCWFCCLFPPRLAVKFPSKSSASSGIISVRNLNKLFSSFYLERRLNVKLPFSMVTLDYSFCGWIEYGTYFGTA